MSLSLTVSGESIQELRQALAGALTALGGGATIAGAVDVAPTGAAEKKPVGRPAKAGKSAADMAAEMGLAPAAAPAPVAAAPVVVTVTEEQIRAKLAELMASRTGDADEMDGMKRVQKVLAQVGAQQIKAVDKSRYAELSIFIDAA